MFWHAIVRAKFPSLIKDFPPKASQILDFDEPRRNQEFVVSVEDESFSQTDDELNRPLLSVERFHSNIK